MNTRAHMGTLGTELGAPCGFESAQPTHFDVIDAFDTSFTFVCLNNITTVPFGPFPRRDQRPSHSCIQATSAPATSQSSTEQLI